MSFLLKIISGLPRPLFMVLLIVGITAICIVDYHVDPRFSLVIFYLLPIFLASWYIGAGESIAISLLCAVGWAVSEYLSRGAFSFPMAYFWNLAVLIFVFLSISMTLSKLSGAMRHEEELARTDTLTGIANRKAFFETAKTELSRMNRYKRLFTIAYLDLDDFKLINDQQGHEAGDSVLRCITEAIRSTLRSSDLVARVGGDEFAMLLPETGEEQAKSVVAKINASIREALEKQKTAITYSIGVVTYIRPPATVDDMLRKADHMMHAAKREGKNGIRYLVWKESATVR